MTRFWILIALFAISAWAGFVLGGCSLFAGAAKPTVDLNGDGYINEADIPIARAVASAIPGGTGILDIIGYGFGALGLGGAVRQTIKKRGAEKARDKMRKGINKAVLADPETDDVLLDELHDDLEPPAREKIRRKREARNTLQRTRESIEDRQK